MNASTETAMTSYLLLLLIPLLLLLFLCSRPRHALAFLHPHADASGGGERVLWTALSLHSHAILYTFSKDKNALLCSVRERFNIHLDPGRVTLVSLWLPRVVISPHLPCTRLAQAAGTVALAIEAALRAPAVTVVDTAGMAFAYPVLRVLGASVVGYVHYPFIHGGPGESVNEKTAGQSTENAEHSYTSSSGIDSKSTSELTPKQNSKHTSNSSNTSNTSNTALNTCSISSKNTAENTAFSNSENSPQMPINPTQTNPNPLRTTYNSTLLALYAASLRTATICTNGTWTQSRLTPLLRSRPPIVFPPCSIPPDLKEQCKKQLVVSLAQFRPEKDHQAQIRAFAAYRDMPGADLKLRFSIFGSCRSVEIADDAAIVSALRAQIQQAGLSEFVTLYVNLPWPDIQRALAGATVAFHTMQDEHFGISVVELMALEVIPIVHASGGPLLDIVTPFEGERTGYTALTDHAFAAALLELTSMSVKDRTEMGRRCRQSVLSRFTDQIFCERWAEFCEMAGIANCKTGPHTAMDNKKLD